MIRLGLALKGPNILYRGIWPTYFAAGFADRGGSGAAYAPRRSANRPRTRSWRLIWPRPPSGSITPRQRRGGSWPAMPRARVLMAAYAAQAGFHRRHRRAAIPAISGRLWHRARSCRDERAEHRRGAGARFLQAMVRGAPNHGGDTSVKRNSRRRRCVAEISEVTAFVPPPHLKMIDHGIHPGNRASFLTSLPYQLAMVALYPDAMLDLGEPAAQSLPALQSFMARVRLSADDALLADYPKRWPARVVVTTPSGRHERRVREVPGDPARPFAKPTCGTSFKMPPRPCLTNEPPRFYSPP